MSFAGAVTATVVLLVSFALAGALHVAICWGLAKKAGKGQALLAFFVPFAGPVLAFRAGLRVRAIAYVVALVVHAVTRLVV